MALAAISAVIPNRDGAELLRLTLPPLLRELRKWEHEVVVVDDASQDDSCEVLSREFPAVRVVALQSNVGFGRACGAGFSAARHELVLLLNSDMEVTAGSLDLLLEHFADPTVFAAGPVYLSDRPEAPRPPALGPDAPLRPGVGAPAGGGFFRRQPFLDLGGFDPLYYPFYWEDIDLGWTAWRAGWRIVYDQRTHFVHLESATIRRLYSAQYVARIRARNRCLFGWKNLDDSALLRRHNLLLVGRALTALLRRGDPSNLLGLLDALPMRNRARAGRVGDTRTDHEILKQFDLCLDDILRV